MYSCLRLLTLSQIRSSYSDFFVKTPEYEVNQFSYSRVYTRSNYISNSLFSYVTFQSAIYYSTKQPIELLIESSAFNNCSSYSNGGAVYYFATVGDLVLNGVCFSDCYTESGSGQALYTYSGSASIHLFNMVSVHHCSPFIGTSSLNQAMYISRGNQNHTRLNSSFNYANTHASFYINGVNSFSINFSNIVQNSATNSFVMRFETHSASGFMKYSNIIQNTSPITSQAVLAIYGVIDITFSIFLQNYGVLFYKESIYSFTISKSVVVHLGGFPISTGSSLNSVQTVTSMTETYSYSHYYTYYCPAQGVIGEEISPCQTLPPEPTIAPSLPATPTACYQESQQNSIILWNLASNMFASINILLFAH